MTHILLVEDDLRLAKLVQQFLQQNNLQVSVIHRGDLVEEFILKHDPDLVILDIMLPQMDGFSICRKIRPHYKNPILFLTAKDSDLDHVLGLNIGADDYIIKPIEPHVLLARIHSVLRRMQDNKNPENDSINIGQLSIDQKSRKVILAGRQVELTSHEFELLWLLATNAGKTQSRDYIYKIVIGREYDGLDRSVDVRISRLRKKLGDNNESPYKIITVWGKGYLLSASAWE